MKGFIDPTPDIPVDAAEFLSFLDLSPLSATLEKFYSEPWRSRHPPEAMLKLLSLYKLKHCSFLTQLWRELDAQTVKLLGFKWKPSYKTVWHWLNKRVGPQGLETIHAALIQAINQALAAQGVRLGKRASGDATPIEAKLNDEEAAYNGYYKEHCYLVHRLVCCTTNLTLQWFVTHGNVDEGKLLVPMLVKAIVNGVTPEEAAFDNGYAWHVNYEVLGLMGIRPLIGFREKAKPSWRGKPETLKLRYRKMVKAGVLNAQKLEELGMSPDPELNSLEDVVYGLAIAGQHEYVGAYYKNHSWDERCRNGHGWLEPYCFMRSVVEGCHGHQKDWLGLDDLKAKGLSKAMLHTALCMLSEAAVAYTRVQHTVVKALTSHAFIR